MSRLEGIAKAGYFPTPPDVVDRVACLIQQAGSEPHRAIRLIDPCCGTGAALKQLADQVGGETFGIEIASDRFEEARHVLDHTLHASALTARLANAAFSCLFLNPPYEYDDESRRLEHAFLTETSRVLCPGGLLVYIVPKHRLAVSARYLAGHYTRFSCCRFPDPEFEAYKQVVLLAVKRDTPINDAGAREQLASWSLRDELPVLPVAGTGQAIHGLPSLAPGPVLFSSLFFDPQAAAAEARQYGLWHSPAVAERLWPGEERPVRPLMPLRRGHLALLIAAGFLNNLVLDSDGRRLLVKGRTYKEQVEVASDDPDLKIEREVLRTSVVTLDLADGAFQTIEHGGASQPVTLTQAA
jgi:ubiquinone/menaquinone biosynthesis C-methylase UbiE